MEYVLFGFFAQLVCIGIANLVRLQLYSRFLMRQIDRVYEARVAGDRSATYPHIHLSYNNLKWYDIFNYKFDTIVVYEKEGK